MKPGESITFKSPWAISEDDEVYAMAFFIDAARGTAQHGSYTLTFTRSGQASLRGYHDILFDYIRLSTPQAKDAAVRNEPDHAE